MKKRISLALSLCLAASMLHIPVSAGATEDYIDPFTGEHIIKETKNKTVLRVA